MKTVDRQKICTNCDGRIPVEAAECIYCGAEQQVEPAKQQGPLFKQQSLQDSLTSLYTPPYASKPQPEKPPMMKAKVPQSTPIINTPEETTPEQSAFLPMLFLILGGNLLILGLLQLIFSDQGFLRLEWNSSYWFIYCLISLPLFYFGFKKINQLQ